MRCALVATAAVLCMYWSVAACTSSSGGPPATGFDGGEDTAITIDSATGGDSGSADSTAQPDRDAGVTVDSTTAGEGRAPEAGEDATNIEGSTGLDAPADVTPDACASLQGSGTQAAPYTAAAPLADCAAYLAAYGACAPSGWYLIEPWTQSPFADQCDMTTLGGGWTLVIASYSAALSPATRNYLYELGGRWYQSPPTTLDWNWSVGQELPGNYAYFDGTDAGTFPCHGSSETPQFGIGCSSGPGTTAKCVPLSTQATPPNGPSPFAGQCSICQDVPNAFGSSVPCPSGVDVYARAATAADAGPDAGAGWVYVGIGDCQGSDRSIGYSTGSDLPVVADCSATYAGLAAVCWNQTTYANGTIPGAQPACTYKTVAPASCTGGSNPGYMYVCRP